MTLRQRPRRFAVALTQFQKTRRTDEAANMRGQIRVELRFIGIEA